MANQKDKIEDIKQKLLKCGFIIDKNRERDTTVDISKRNKPKLKEKLRKLIDEI